MAIETSRHWRLAAAYGEASKEEERAMKECRAEGNESAAMAHSDRRRDMRAYQRHYEEKAYKEE